MSLYEECLSLLKGPQVSVKNKLNAIALITSTESRSLHVTTPSFISVEQTNSMQRSVYYISDLHLVHHIIRYVKEAASEDLIRAYIHSIVVKLFEGEFGKEIRAFKTPVVLFGGDISSSFSIAEIFYRDFLSTWEQIVDEKQRFYNKELSPIIKELDTASVLFSEWKEKHPWIKNAQKPLEEYSDRKVPRRIKELRARIAELRQQADTRRREFGLGLFWESAYESAKKHPYVYAIMGNHELWDFDSYSACERAYMGLFEELNIVFLNDKISPLGHFNQPMVSEMDSETRRFTTRFLKKDEDPKRYDSLLFYLENILGVGGLGFAAMNPSFNANQGIYGVAVSRDEEIRRCEEWRRLFEKATETAKQNHCSLVVLSHNPISDWLAQPEKCANCFVFSGHTHRNIAYGGENNTFVFADNQVGYSGKRFRFKRAVLHLPRNPFASDPDGFREITCEEYKEYYSYVREPLPGTGIIERQIKLYEAKLYVIKQDGYVGFFLTAPRGVYICNGGQIRKIGSPESLERYMENFMAVINNYITALSPLRRVQEQLAAYIKSFGGKGRIHGTIVDIDFENHVMVNTSDGTLTFYNSPMFGLVKTYPDIGTLLHAHCPELEAAYLAIGSSQLVPITEELSAPSSSYEHVDIKNSQYALSRRINALQRLFDKHILRDWNPELEMHQLQE